MADAIPVHSDAPAKKPAKGSKAEPKVETPPVPVEANPYKRKGGAEMPGPTKLIRQDF